MQPKTPGRGGLRHPAAALEACAVPSVFTGDNDLPAEWSDRTHLAKPVASQDLLDLLVSLAPGAQAQPGSS